MVQIGSDRIRPEHRSDDIADCKAWHGGHADRRELIFRFSTERSLDDSQIHFREGRADTRELVVDRNLQFALANLGYTVNEFRRVSGNWHAASEYLQRSARRRRAPIVTWKQLVDLIDDTGSASFLVCLHTFVPVEELTGLDLAKPITFDRCCVATLDPNSGAFCHVTANGPVTVAPGDGRILGGSHLRRPQMTRLISAHHHASVRN